MIISKRAIQARSLQIRHGNIYSNKGFKKKRIEENGYQRQGEGSFYSFGLRQ